MRLVIRGHDLPRAAGAGHARIGVALQVRTDPVGVVPGDAALARWDTEVNVVGGDFRGPAVHGRRGDRFVYLTWGDLADDGFAMFRRAKLMLSRVDPALVEPEGGWSPTSADRREGRPALRPGRPPAVSSSRLGQASGGRSL